MTVPRTDSAPAVDGTLDDPCWREASQITNFLVHNTGGRLLERPSPRVLFCYDDEALYIGFESPQPQGVETAEAPRDSDKLVSDHDSFEFFLRPTMTWEHSYYQLIVNASNSIFDGKVKDNSWDGEFIYRATVSDGVWRGEIKVPYTTFEDAGVPEAGDEWTFNVCRNFRAGGIRFSQWTNTGVSYHDAMSFARMRFGGRDEWVREQSVAVGEDKDIRVVLDAWDKARTSAGILFYRQGEIVPSKSIVSAPGELLLKTAEGSLKNAVAELWIRKEQADDPVLYHMVRVSPKTKPAPPKSKTEEKSTEPATKQAKAEGPPPYEPRPPTPEELQAARERRKLWENNSLGKDEWVPPPWTPVVVDGQTVSVWGRDYRFDNSLFPTQIESRGEELLSRPIFLDLQTEKGRVKVAAGKLEVVSRTDEKATLRGRFEGIGLTVEALTELEFDGMAKVTLRIVPTDEAIQVKKLALRIPIKPDRAQYYHWAGSGWDPSVSNAGSIPEDGLLGGFRGILWVGDKKRGVCWFAQDQDGYEISQPHTLLRLFKSETYADWNIRVNFIDTAYLLKGEKTFVFGYEATPVKPMPRQFRDERFPFVWHWGRGYLDPIPGAFVNLGGGNRKTSLEKVFESNPDYLLVLAGGAGAESDYQGQVLSEQWLYSQEWRGTKHTRINYPKNNWAGHVYYHGGGGGLDTSYQDFMVYYINEVLQKHRMDGIYFDGHGGPMWSAREFLKRVYKLFRKVHPEQTRILVHSSTRILIPVIGFADFHLNGEQYNSGRLRVGAHYTDVLPIDRIMAEFRGEPWGTVPAFLPELDAIHRKLIAPTREMIALLQVHDVLLTGAWCNSNVYRAYKSAINRFGIAESDFTGYWEDAVSHSDSEIKVSVYRHRTQDKWLLFISNLTPKARTTIVKLSADTLGFEPERIEDLENNFELPVGPEITVPVNGLNFRMIGVFGKEH
ncbi:MAG: DUF6067 family protein [Candidatus Pacebacteria bacterium]|nr:DUF6067 family protein [Candidatus Paceibacterota bacterium]